MKNLNTVAVNKIIVHGGVFHADDVLCCAMARLINPDVTIERSNTPSSEDVASDGSNGVWVADVGGGRFDHHQADARTHENGSKFAACGLLYEVWEDTLTSEASREAINNLRSLIGFIEEADNGGRMVKSNTIVNSYRPCWDDSFSMNDGFNRAVDFMENSVRGILHPVQNDDTLVHNLVFMLFGPEVDDEGFNSRDFSGDILITGYVSSGQKDINVAHAIVDIYGQLIRAEQSQLRADKYLKKHLGDRVNDTVVFLEQCLPWMRTLIPSKALYVSYPAIRGGWNIQCVPVAVGDRTAKKPFPAEWLSTPESRPTGCTFVHPAGFLASFETVDDAEAAAKLLTALAQE